MRKVFLFIAFFAFHSTFSAEEKFSEEERVNQKVWSMFAKGVSFDIQLLQAARSNWPQNIPVLLKCGANIETRDIDGMTPLMWASYSGNKEAVEGFLVHGATTEAQDKYGWTAFMAATSRNKLEVVQFLFSKGACFDSQDHEGKRAIDYAPTPSMRTMIGNYKKARDLLQKSDNYSYLSLLPDEVKKEVVTYVQGNKILEEPR